MIIQVKISKEEKRKKVVSVAKEDMSPSMHDGGTRGMLRCKTEESFCVIRVTQGAELVGLWIKYTSHFGIDGGDMRVHFIPTWWRGLEFCWDCIWPYLWSCCDVWASEEWITLFCRLALSLSYISLKVLKRVDTGKWLSHVTCQTCLACSCRCETVFGGNTSFTDSLDL